MQIIFPLCFTNAYFMFILIKVNAYLLILVLPNRHWTNCHWKLNQLKGDTIWVLIQLDFRRSMDCQHLRILPALVPLIHMRLLQKIQNLVSHLTQGSYSNILSFLTQILTEVAVLTCQAFILRLIDL